MPTLVYTPEVRAFIKVTDGRIIDVSNDLVSGQIQRRSDGVSSFNFSLQNAQRKYDRLFTPNDRIVVQMKRFTWVRVFSGYLNSVPLFTIWPRVVALSASCSLKRLQYWWWDPHLPSSEALIQTSLMAAQSQSTPDGAHVNADGGIKNVLLAILDRVAGWPNDKVHISAIPNDWFAWSEKVAQQMLASTEATREAIAALQAQIGSNGTLGGTSVGGNVNGVIKPGTDYGGSQFDDKQCGHIEEIWNALSGQHATRDEAIVTYMTCRQESQYYMYSNSNIPESKGFHPDMEGHDHYSVGLYQQQASPYFAGDWGTVQQCMDPKYSTERFLRELRTKVGSRIGSQPKTVSAQQVQGSAFPNAYAQWEPSSTAIVQALMTAGTTVTPANAGGPAAATGTDLGQAGRQITAQQLAQTGVDLVRKDRPGPKEADAVASSNIPYRLGGDSPMETPAAQIQNLDCSSFVDWVYFHATGGGRTAPSGGRSVVSTLKTWCQSRGSGVKSPASDGMRILGALMFNGDHHVGISLGDGVHTVEASHTGSMVHVIANSGWTDYGLPPGVNYNGAQNSTIDFGGDGSGSPAGQTGQVSQTALHAIMLSDTPANSTDPIDELFSNAALPSYTARDDETVAITFSGGLALANDEPLLPYLINLCNSTMRSFCSGPNGDFIAWFPDYYGIWGTAGKIVIEPIELLDFTVDWSDDNLVTHQFMRAATAVQFDITGGQLINAQTYDLANSAVVSIDQPAVMQALFGLDVTDEDTAAYTDFIYRRFGARPQMQEATGVTGSKGLFFLALFMFMRQFAFQYNADVPITFMPEAWPGMLVQIPEFSFQAYITTVTHNFDFSEGGGFSTTLNIASPARLDDRNSALMGLPTAAGAGADKAVKPPNFEQFHSPAADAAAARANAAKAGRY